MPTVLEKNIKSWLLEVIKPDEPSPCTTDQQNVLQGLGELNEKDPKVSGILFEAIVPQSKIRDVAGQYLAQGYFLESLTAVDFAECFEIVYHFNQWPPQDAYPPSVWRGSLPAGQAGAKPCGGGNRSCVKILVPKESGAPSGAESRAESRGNQAPSISSIYKAADWFEREVYDMFGIRFTDHPNLKRLLLPESSEIFPLLKSFKGEPKGSDVAQSLKLIQEDAEGFANQYKETVKAIHESPLLQQGKNSTKDYYLNLGPQHPSTHGVLRVLLRLTGEKVLEAQPIIGYSHRHHEKMMEIQTYLACWPNMGRLDYVGAMSYNFGYALLIEKAMGIQPPTRVEYIRVLTTELNRICSHLLWMGTFLLDLGGFTPFFYCFDDREKILDILEMATGERLTYDYFRFGGLDKDIPAEMIPAIKEFIPNFKKRLRDYDGLVTKNVIFKNRTEGIGVISKEKALAYGITGPSLRAAGVSYDLRRHEPYSIYPQLDFNIPTRTESDVYSRYWIRMKEMEESLKIIAQVIDRIPTGDFTLGKLPKNVPKGEYYSAIESPRGSFGIYLVSDGTLNPYRMKLRTPSFSNLNSLVEMLPGCFVSDMIAVLGSIDIVLPEIDR